jgi:hypothetical protein
MILTLNCPPKSKYTVGSNYLFEISFEIAFEISLNQFIDFTRFIVQIETRLESLSVSQAAQKLKN